MDVAAHFDDAFDVEIDREAAEVEDNHGPEEGFRWRAAAGWTKTEADWALGFYEEGEKPGFSWPLQGIRVPNGP